MRAKKRYPTTLMLLFRPQRSRTPDYEGLRKKDYPLIDIRRPSSPARSCWSAPPGGEPDIMTMGWHMMMRFSPALFGCYIWDDNHSFELIRRGKECVINVPTLDLVNEVVGIGNSTGGSSTSSRRSGSRRCRREGRRAADRGVLRQFRMPPCRREPDPNTACSFSRW